MRILILFFFLLFGQLFAQNCTTETDSTLSLWFKHYKAYYIKADYWRATTLGQQILRRCPKWKPELYREIGFMYRDLLDTIRTPELKHAVQDSLYAIFERGADVTGDKAGWYLLRAASALKYEDRSDSMIGLMLEPAIRLNPLKCPASIIEEAFRITDWKCRRGVITKDVVESKFREYSLLLAKQMLLKDSLREKEEILRVKKSMAYRMKRYLPDSTQLIAQASQAGQLSYEQAYILYARLFALGVQNSESLQALSKRMADTGTETLWQARSILNTQAESKVWMQLAKQETDTMLQSFYWIQAAKQLEAEARYPEAWQVLHTARNTAPGYGKAELEMARFLLRRSEACVENPDAAEYLRLLAAKHYQLGSRKDYQVRYCVRNETQDLNLPNPIDLVSGETRSLNCGGLAEIKAP